MRVMVKLSGDAVIKGGCIGEVQRDNREVTAGYVPGVGLGVAGSGDRG
jgi:hypothetical protein